jgi:cystathionine gamma-synthase
VGRLEGGHALAFASGMAAAAAVLDGLDAGTRVLAPTVSYPGVRGLLAERHDRGLLDVALVDQTDTEATIEAMVDVGLVWAETPNNPLLGITDLRALAAAAHDRGAALAVDTTLAPPLVQRTLDLGADFAVHSATKFLAGHSDALLGAVATRDRDARDELARRRALSGAVPGPFGTFLGLRGIRTLALRLERAQANAAELAGRLAAHPAVSLVRYPGLAEHPGHEVAARQMRGFGALLSFDVAAGAEAAEAVCRGTRLIANATSLGGVETLIERRARYDEEGPHVPASLLRLSVGCENVEDLWADLEQALTAASGG